LLALYRFLFLVLLDDVDLSRWDRGLKYTQFSPASWNICKRLLVYHQYSKKIKY
jgi:hypothetical protein